MLQTIVLLTAFVAPLVVAVPLLHSRLFAAHGGIAMLAHLATVTEQAPATYRGGSEVL